MKSSKIFCWKHTFKPFLRGTGGKSSAGNHIKATFSFHKIKPKTLNWLPYIIICHCTSISSWFIILDKNNCKSFLSLLNPYMSLCVGGVCAHEKTLEGLTGTHTSSFFRHKQVSGRNGDNKWLRMTNVFILCDLLWKVQKNHAANIEGSFNIWLPT